MTNLHSGMRFLRHDLTLLLTLVASVLVAQPTLQLDWQTPVANADGASQLELRTSEAHASGAYFAGYRSTADGLRMYVCNYLTNGNLDWEVDLPSNGQAGLRYLELDGAGNMYVAGFEDVGTSGDPPIHFARLDPQGNVVWHHTFDAQGATDPELSGLTVTDDALYLIGSEEGNGGYPVAWAAAFDLNGNLDWKSAFDPGVNTAFSDIAENGQGGLAACGWADDGYSHLLVGFGTNGAVDWSWPATLTGSDEAWMSDLTADDQGNWIVMGTEEVGAFFEYDAVTFKFSPGGSPTWNMHFNNGFENSGSRVEVAPNGNIMAFVNMADNFDHAVRTIAYNGSGAQQWATNYDIDDFTSLVNARVNGASEIFIGVQDLDSLGFVKLSPFGSVLAEKTYGQDQVDYLGDIAVNSSTVFGCAYSFDALRSQVLFLNGFVLTEQASVVVSGVPLSDAQAGAVTNDGTSVWLASYADAGDSATFAISKLDASGNVLWTKGQKYLSSNPSFSVLTHDNAGNVIGMFQNLINGGDTDVGLVKYDAAGNEVFTILYDSAATLRAGSVTTDPAGNIYVGLYNETSKIMFVSKYTPAGSLVWMEHYVSPSTSFPYADPRRMVYTQQDKLVIGAIHKNAANDNNLYLFQYDANGGIDWQVEVDPQSGNLCSVDGLAVDMSGNVVLFGSSGTSTYTAAGFDLTGAPLWSEGGSTGTYGAPRSLAMDASGNTFLSFSKSSGASFRKLGPSGSLLVTNDHALPSTGSFFFPRGIAVVGSRLAVVGDHLIGSDQVPFEMLLDDQLALLSGRVDSLTQGTFAGLAVDAANNLLHAAYTEGDPGGGTGFRTSLVRQFSIGSVGLGEMVEADHGLSIFPNPMTSNARLICNDPMTSEDQARVVDVNGRMVRTLRGQGTNTLEIQREGLPAGLYLVQVLRASGTSETTRLVVE